MWLRSVLLVVLCIVSHHDQVSVHAAGWCDGIEHGEGCGPDFELGDDGQRLHLNEQENEQPRDSVWGGGLIETVLYDVDVFVAGGGSAGVSAAIAAARSGANTVLVNGRSVSDACNVFVSLFFSFLYLESIYVPL